MSRWIPDRVSLVQRNDDHGEVAESLVVPTFRVL
jgi:hypothetical protein